MEDVASNVFKPVSSTLDVPALEREMAELWRERDTVARYLTRNDDSATRFSFLDGPITANNPMGVHHAWGRTYKDLFQRYHTMLGDRQRYQNGFDCQGLWIEVEVETRAGLHEQAGHRGLRHRPSSSSSARSASSALPIRSPSRRSAWATGWTGTTRYFTNSDENNYTIWRFLQDVPGARAPVQGPRRHALVPPLRHRPLEHEIVDRGLPGAHAISRLTFRLPITTAGHEGESLLVWTTTPWTLSGNVAAAVHPELVYELVEGADGQRYVAQPRLDGPRGAGRGTRSARRRARIWSASTYRGPFDELPVQEGVEHRVIAWDEVSDEEGTGIVHIAPGCGEEDFAPGQASTA